MCSIDPDHARVLVKPYEPNAHRLRMGPNHCHICSTNPDQANMLVEAQASVSCAADGTLGQARSADEHDSKATPVVILLAEVSSVVEYIRERSMTALMCYTEKLRLPRGQAWAMYSLQVIALHARVQAPCMVQRTTHKGPTQPLCEARCK